MSLVDYASSSDDDVSVEEGEERHHESQTPKPQSFPPTLPQNQCRKPVSSESYAQSSTPVIEKLPDASLLLNSPAISPHLLNASDHSSRVAVAMAESASRKRDLNGLGSSVPRSKLPRGNLPHSKNVPDTVGGMLVPPQLTGRSNVVTEDITKLFVRRHSDPSSD